MAARTSELGSSTLMLSIDSSEFSKGLKDAKAKAEQFSQDVWKHVQKGSKRFAQEHAKTFRKVGMAMSASVTLPVAGFALAAVKASVDFEEAMEEVIAVSGATGAQVDALTERAKDLGTTTEKTAVQAAEGMKFLAMAGFEVEEVMAALPGVMDLAMVSGMDLGRASDITSNIMSGFGETAEQTGRIVDVMALTMSSSNTNIEQLGEAMAYVAPAARAAGMDIEQTSALIGKLGDAGIQGSRAGTNLQGVLTALLKPSSEAKEILDDLGVSIRTSTGEMRPLVDILGDFDEAGATAADVAGIFGRRNSTAALAIMGSLGRHQGVQPESLRSCGHDRSNEGHSGRRRRHGVEETDVGVRAAEYRIGRVRLEGCRGSGPEVGQRHDSRHCGFAVGGFDVHIGLGWFGCGGRASVAGDWDVDSDGFGGWRVGDRIRIS